MISLTKRSLRTGTGFHPVAWIVIIGTFLARTGFFMTIPFLGIYLGKVKGIDPATIGAILGISLFVGTLSSFVGGALSDRLGRFPVMISSIMLWAFVFVGFAFAVDTWQFFLLSAMNGLFRNIFEPAARALLADVTPEEKRSDAFNARYFAINIGGAIGPLIGLKLGVGGTDSMLPFLLSAAIYGLFALLLIYFGARFKDHLHSAQPKGQSEAVSFRSMLKIIFADKVFLYFLLGNTFVAGAYSHLDTTVSQFIGHDRVNVYSILFVANTLSVLVLQYPLSRLMKRYSSSTALKLGCLLFGLGLFGLGAFHSIILLVLSIAVFTSGEILCFVIGDVLIGEIAPDHLRGAYFGAGGFAFIGQSLSAWLGGYLLKTLGFDQGALIFGVLMVLAFAAFPFFHRGQQLRGSKAGHTAADKMSA
ncbi:MDR family MFS transporter [Gorillibacterium massiliense]|uniref:MDR family MFS transporter n=1 Tax=Gorillibacterium massiliense TaxID=1280390 RepID=UPI0004BA584A|nr:MFS transporter [Gorillibacterium massiliense]